MYFLVALAIGFIGAAPAFLAALKSGDAQVKAGVVLATAYTLLWWLVLWLTTPSAAGPLFGWFGGLVLISWIMTALVSGVIDEDINFAATFPLSLGVIFVVIGVSASSCFRSSDMAAMIGQVERRNWTEDNQPADPAHLRLVSRRYALYLARKQLGEAGAIGSQFQVSESEMTIQKVKGELWWVVPLDFASYGAWTATDGVPGYIMVHAESPSLPPKLIDGQHFRYTPGAFFSHSLERHLRADYFTKYLTDYSLEIDEAGKAWWVVTVAEPTIGWGGEKVSGVSIVDPETGAQTFHALGSIPDWVDRVFPEDYVDNYIDWSGEYHSGWWNAVWSKTSLTEGGSKLIVYGSDGDAWWASDMTSTNGNDDSIVGLMYVNCRTGKAVHYAAKGGTQEAAISAANQKVTDMKYYGSGVTFANVYGILTAVVPISASNDAFQGVAFVRLDNLQVGYGKDVTTAMREYQKVVSGAGNQSAVSGRSQQMEARGRVQRFMSEVRDGQTAYFLIIEGQPRIYTGSSDLSPELPLTSVGDEVAIRYVASGETVVPLLTFDNAAIVLDATADQKDVIDRVEGRRDEARRETDERILNDGLKDLSDEDKAKAAEFVRKLRESGTKAPATPEKK